MAALNGNKAVLNQLADISNVAAKGEHGTSALTLACRFGNTEIVRYFVDNQAQFFKLLLSLKASTKIQVQSHFKSLMLASRGANFAVVKLLCHRKSRCLRNFK